MDSNKKKIEAFLKMWGKWWQNDHFGVSGLFKHIETGPHVTVRSQSNKVWRETDAWRPQSAALSLPHLNTQWFIHHADAASLVQLETGEVITKYNETSFYIYPLYRSVYKDALKWTKRAAPEKQRWLKPFYL